jgi:membrane-bound metal-dependent hydrolase YbcI (DUF457 family)
MAGISLGSLLPELDAPDSKIMHGRWRRIGSFGKRFFYKPLVKLLHKKTDTFRDEHRGFLHSLIGWLFTSLFFAGIAIVLYPILWFAWYIWIGIPVPILWFVWYFWIGIPIGFLLHLVEDSFTKSGVRWFFPKGKPLKSKTRLHKGSEYFLLLMFFWVFGSLTVFVYYLLPSSTITLLLTIGVTLALLVLLHRLNPKISRLGDRLYSKKGLVEASVENQGGKKVDPSEPCVSTLKITISEDPSRKHYFTRITDVGGVYRLERDWRGLPDSYIEARYLQEGDIIEMQIFEENRKMRLYFIVQNGKFCPFMKLIL